MDSEGKYTDEFLVSFRDYVAALPADYKKDHLINDRDLLLSIYKSLDDKNTPRSLVGLTELLSPMNVSDRNRVVEVLAGNGSLFSEEMLTGEGGKLTSLKEWVEYAAGHGIESTLVYGMLTDNLMATLPEADRKVWKAYKRNAWYRGNVSEFILGNKDTFDEYYKNGCFTQKGLETYYLERMAKNLPMDDLLDLSRFINVGWINVGRKGEEKVPENLSQGEAYFWCLFQETDHAGRLKMMRDIDEFRANLDEKGQPTAGVMLVLAREGLIGSQRLLLRKECADNFPEEAKDFWGKWRSLSDLAEKYVDQRLAEGSVISNEFDSAL